MLDAGMRTGLFVLNNPLRYNDPSGHSWEDYLPLRSAYLEWQGQMALDDMVRAHTEYGSYQEFMDANRKNGTPRAGNLGAVVAGAHAAAGIAGAYITVEASIVAPEARAVDEVEAAGGAEGIAKIEANQTRGWKVGDPINNLTSKGDVPSWNTVRQRFWKNEALNSKAGEYSAENLTRMKKGLAPQRVNPNTGQLESMELHHTPAQRNGGLFNVKKVWPDEHAAIDPYRHTKK